MKRLFFILGFVTSVNGFSADTFTCTVFKKVIVNVQQEAIVPTGIESAELHPHNEFVLDGANDELSFKFQLSKNNYSLELNSLKYLTGVSFESDRPLDPWYDDTRLVLKINQEIEKVGTVKEIILECGAL